MVLNSMVIRIPETLVHLLLIFKKQWGWVTVMRGDRIACEIQLEIWGKP